MTDEAILFAKLNGQKIPITTRIEWLPDGTIIPISYWTPDGACFEVKHVYEMVLLAYLKDRGVGVRFKVRSESVEDDVKCEHQEAYLYFADNWFCGKNFIDNRYGHGGKEFIPVTLDVFPDGRYELISFRVKDERYIVEKTLAIEPRGNFHAGGVGLWHKVLARLVNSYNDRDPNPDESVVRSSALYFEVNKWFVSIKDDSQSMAVLSSLNPLNTG